MHESYPNKIRILEGKQKGWMMNVHPWWAQLTFHLPKAQDFRSLSPLQVALTLWRVQGKKRCTVPLFNSPNGATKTGNVYMLPKLAVWWKPSALTFRCLLLEPPVLRNDCEIPTVALCLGGLNVLLGWSGTGSPLIFGDSIYLGLELKGACHKKVFQGELTFSDSEMRLPSSSPDSKEMWGAEDRAGGRGQPPVFIVEMPLPISRRLLRWLTL